MRQIACQPKTHNMYRILMFLSINWLLFTLDSAGKASDADIIIINLLLSFTIILLILGCHIGHRRQQRMANRAFEEL